MMEIRIFSTRVPPKGQIGPWLPLTRRAIGGAVTLAVTAFRPYRIDWQEAGSICGEIEWRGGALDPVNRIEWFDSGLVDVVLGADSPCPRIRFYGEGADGADLRVLVQFHSIEAIGAFQAWQATAVDLSEPGASSAIRAFESCERPAPKEMALFL
jgi:hypothetical protein